MSAVEVQNPAVEEEIPALEEAEVPQAGKQPRRNAKAMAKMGLKPEPNITKVTFSKKGGLSFAIASPEVYRFPGSNTFIAFGEPALDNLPTAEQTAARAATVAAAAPETVQEVQEGDEEDLDQGNLDDKDINAVMKQANVARGKAIAVLKRNNGDIVNSIMELTM